MLLLTRCVRKVLGLQKKSMPKPSKVKASSTSASSAPKQTESENEEVPRADPARTAEDPEPTQIVAHEEL